jgi:predicted phosphodiesterase
MRLAIVSDIHGNLTALDAVVADLGERGVDLVLQGGDVALMGCQPAQVIDVVRELEWPGIVGNTDELLWRADSRAEQEQAAPKLHALLHIMFEQYAPATRELIGQERLDWLRKLPATHREKGLLLLHASPGDLWRAPMPDAKDADLLKTYGPCEAGMVVYGHIHRPFVRSLSGITVANGGSVGSPFDGDPRAAYLLIDDGRPEVIRVAYDLEREASLLLGSGYPDAERIAEMRRLGRFVAVGDDQPPAPTMAP